MQHTNMQINTIVDSNNNNPMCTSLKCVTW